MFLLRDLGYRLSSDADPASACTQPRQPMQPLDSQAEEGVGLVCGFFHFQSGLSTLIVDGLADWILLRADDPAGHAARALFELIRQSAAAHPRPRRRCSSA